MSNPNQFKFGDRVISDAHGIGYVIGKENSELLVRFSGDGGFYTYSMDGSSNNGDYLIPYPQWFDILETLLPSIGLVTGIVLGVWAW